jgi:hypothetical protein
MYVAGRSGSGKSKLLEILIRQLIAAWPHSPAGMLVLDPHAALYDAVLKWLAASGLNHVPVIPFDLRSSWICSLNILRPRPDQDPAPLIHAAVRAILHGWKQGDATETPRLAKWLTTLLMTLYASHCTLLETLDIIRSREIRSALARRVEDAMAKSVWMAAGNMREADFLVELESTVNRLGRFLSTRVLQLAFSQNDVSLDMLAAMERGHIVLACLATEGSRIAEEDAAVVGSLLVNEVWSAAKHRGKREDGVLRPFHIIIDEFQEYVSPVIAQSLAQLRGMGVGLIAAHQSPQQLMDLGPMGRQVLNAIVANTATQVVFQTAHPDDLDLLVPWLFRGVVDANAVKHQGFSTRVLGHQIRYMESTSRSLTEGTAESANWTHTDNMASTEGTSRTHSESEGESHSTQRSHSRGQSTGLSLGDGACVAESQAESEAEGTTESQSSSQSRQKSTGGGESRHLDADYDSLAKIVGPEPVTNFDEVFEDEDELYRQFHKTLDQSKSDNQSEGTSESSGLATTRSTSRAQARQESESRSESMSFGANEAFSEGESESSSFESSDSESTSESTTNGTSDAVGGGYTTSRSASRGSTRSPMLIPQLGKEALPPQYRSVDEQLFVFSQSLSLQPDRHAVVRTGTTPPQQIITPTVAPAQISAKGARAWANLKLKKLEFALTFDEATRRLADRRRAFEAKFLGPGNTDEPKAIVRRIKE